MFLLQKPLDSCSVIINPAGWWLFLLFKLPFAVAFLF